MKADENTFGVRQSIAEALDVGTIDHVEGPWIQICKDFRDTPHNEKSPCKLCRTAIHTIAAWDKSGDKVAGLDPVKTLKSTIGEDRYAAFMGVYMAAYTRLLHSFALDPEKTPAKKPAKETPAKKPAKPRVKRPDIDIELPERIRKTKDPDMVKVPLIDDPIPIEDVVLSPFEAEIINRTKNPLAVGAPVERVFASIAGVIEGMDRTRELITFAYLPEDAAKKLIDHIAGVRAEAEAAKEQETGLMDALIGVARKIPRSILREKTSEGWDVVVHVFTPIAIGIVLNRQAMIKEAIFEEFLWVFDGAAFVELIEIVCRMFVVEHGEKPDRVMLLQGMFLAQLTKSTEADDSRIDMYLAAKKVVEEVLGSIPEVVEIATALERAIVEEDE